MNKSTTTKPMQASGRAENGFRNEDIVDQAKKAASTVASKTKEGVTEQLDQQKDKAVEVIENVSTALRGVGEKLKDDSPLSGYADRAASGIDRVARLVAERDVAELVGQVEKMARREPALFVGGAFAIGLLAGRFLKSSARRDGGRDGGGGDDDLDAIDEEWGAEGYAELGGYDGESGLDGEFLSDDALEDDDDSDYDDDDDEPVVFQPDPSLGFGTGSSAGIGASVAEEPMRTTKPQGSSFGAPGLAGASATGSSAIGGGVNTDARRKA